MSAPEARLRWIMLALMAWSMVTVVFAINLVPPQLSLIRAEQHLSNTQGGLLISMFMLPGIIVAIPAGVMVQRYGQRRVGLLAFACMVGGTALFAGGEFSPLLVLGRVLSGAGAMTLLVVIPQILAHWFVGRELGTAMGVQSAAMGVGFTSSFVTLAWAGAQFGWRFTSWMVALFALLTAILFVLAFRLPPPAPELELEKAANLSASFRVGLLTWLVGIAWLLDNATTFSLLTFTPVFLVDQGFTVEAAGFAMFFNQLPSIFLAPVVGLLVDRVGRHHKEVFIVGGLAGMIVATVLVPWAVNWIIPVMLLYGLVNIFVVVPIFALLPDLLPREKLGVGFGILSASLSAGGVAGPLFVGLALDVTGSYLVGYPVMAAFSFVAAIAMVIIRWQRGRITVPASR